MRRLIEKKTGTYADSLEAVGTASLLEDLGLGRASILDVGPHFAITSERDLPPDQWQSPTLGYPYIWERGKEPEKPLGDYLDYEEAKQKRDAWNKFQEAQKKSRGRLKTALESADVEPPPQPPPEFRVAAILASMRKGWNADRNLVKWAHLHQPQFIHWIQASLGVRPDIPAQELPVFTNSQVLNPIAGKGVSAPKTELRSAGSVPSPLTDPFSEWMKFRGLWRAMLLYRLGDDFKFFALEPADITAIAVALVRDKLAGLNLWGGIRLDIEAAFRCAEVLIRYSDVAQSHSEPLVFLRRRTPRSVISGMRLAYFRSLGTAAALMNDAFLPLPGWFQIGDSDDANRYLAIIEETIGSAQSNPRTWGCLGSLNDDQSDDGRILQQYRQWLLTEDLWELLDFHARFAVHLMGRLGAKEWARPFSAAILDDLFIRTFDRSYHVKQIIEDPGFKSVARAIRNTTIYALGLRESGPTRREVRFGLAQQWKQKMKAGPKDFVSELAQFVQDQNWEVVHRQKGRGHVVTTEHLNSLLALIENPALGPELVGSLLLAYGYARAPKVEESSSPDEELALAQEK